MADDEKMLTAEAWVVLEPSFARRGENLNATGLKITGVRKARPTGRDPVVKLRLRIPARAFAPLAPTVTIDIPEEWLVLPEPEVSVEVPTPEGDS